MKIDSIVVLIILRNQKLFWKTLNDSSKNVLASFPKKGGLLYIQRKLDTFNCPLYFYSEKVACHFEDIRKRISIIDNDREFFAIINSWKIRHYLWFGGLVPSRLSKNTSKSDREYLCWWLIIFSNLLLIINCQHLFILSSIVQKFAKVSNEVLLSSDLILMALNT